MALRTRSNNSVSFKNTDNVDIKIEEVSRVKTENIEVDIDLGSLNEVPNMSTAPTIKEKDTVTKAETVAPAAPAAEYEEDMIDYGDDELYPAVDSGIGSDDTPIDFEGEDIKLEDIKEEITAEEQAEIEATERVAAEESLMQARYIMSLGPQTLLTQSDMAGALQLNEVGDTVIVNVCVNGVKYEITWKVAGFEETEPQDVIEQCAALATTQQPALTVDTAPRKPSFSLRDAAPLSGSTLKAAPFTEKCKFGKFCTKGAACPFDHTIKPKLCTWVNTAQGCTKGFECEFSHDNEGTKCTRSPSRFTCANGKGCAFRHDDDVRKASAPSLKPKPVAQSAPPASVQQIQVVDSTPPANAPKGPKAASSPPANAPTGPKANGTAPQLGKGAGQKRNRDDDDDEAGNSVQRQKVSHLNGNNSHRAVKQHRGRGRGRGRGGARVGVATGGGGFSIKGAAAGRQ